MKHFSTGKLLSNGCNFVARWWLWWCDFMHCTVFTLIIDIMKKWARLVQSWNFSVGFFGNVVEDMFIWLHMHMVGDGTSLVWYSLWCTLPLTLYAELSVLVVNLRILSSAFLWSHFRRHYSLLVFLFFFNVSTVIFLIACHRLQTGSTFTVKLLSNKHTPAAALGGAFYQTS